MTVLGIDPSLTATGYCVLYGAKVVDAGTIKSKLKGIERLADIVRQLGDVFDKHPIEMAIIEGLAYQSHRVADLSGLSWTIRLLLFSENISYRMVNPKTFKKVFAGHGNAKKEDIAKLIKRKYKYTFGDDHQADAYGLAKIYQLGKLDKMRGVEDFVRREKAIEFVGY